MEILSLQELEATLKSTDPQKRRETLHAVAEMFLSSSSDRPTEKIDLYDELLNVLASGSEPRDLAAVSRLMAPIKHAPPKLIRRFAQQDDIQIAGPILTLSPQLSTDELCELAQSQSNSHLLAISRRRGLAENVTDILVARGDAEVARSVVHNETARFSLAGLERLVERAATDPIISERLQSRGDVDLDVFTTLLTKVRAKVNEHLMSAALAQNAVKLLVQENKLDEMQIIDFANSSRYNETVASLAALSNINFQVVENMMYPHRTGGIILIGKSLGMAWPTLDAVLRLAVVRNGVLPDLKAAQREFLSLSRATAERILRFWRVRQAISQ